MKKKLIKTILFILIFSIILNSRLLASNQNTTQIEKCWESPSVCLATPDSLNLYLDFQKELSSLLKSNPFETVTESISTPEWWLFTNKLLHLSNPNLLTENIATKALNAAGTAAERLIVANITTLFLFQMSAVSTISDGLLGFTILLDERPIVRDWKKLLDIDWDLSTRAYDLGQWGNITKTIKDSWKIQKILDRYQDKGLFLPSSQFPQSIKYTDLFLELMKINASIKQFLALRTTTQLDSDSAFFYLKLNPERISKLQEDYQCLDPKYWMRCNQSLKNFTASIKNILGNSKKTWISVMEKFETALNRLQKSISGFKNLNSKKWEKLTSYEKELLRGLGIHTDQKGFNPIGLSEKMKQQRKQAKDWFVSTKTESIRIFNEIVDDTSKFWNNAKKNFNEYKKKQEEQKAKTQKSKEEQAQLEEKLKKRQQELEEQKRIAEEQFITNSLKSFQERQLGQTLKEGILTLIKKEKEIQEKMELSSPLALTNEFWKLAQDIKNIENTIGNKEGWLRKNLYNVCSYQCSNKPQLECYTK